MRYRIHSSAFTQQAPQGGVIPIKAGFRALFLKESAGCLLEQQDVWVDFDAMTQGATAEQLRDLRDGLTLLACFDIAQVEEEKPLKPCRVAGERDYRRISAFLAEHAGKGHNQSLQYVPSLHHEDGVRARQFNNHEYNFIAEKDGQLRAVFLVRPPAEGDVARVVYLQHVIYDQRLSPAEQEALLGVMLAEVENAFRQDYVRLRYQYCSPCQDDTLAALVKQGFRKVCTLEKEMMDGADLTIYDRVMGG